MVTHDGDFCVFGVETQFVQRMEDGIRFLGESCPVELATLELLTAKCDGVQMTFCFCFVSGGADFLSQMSEALGVCGFRVKASPQIPGSLGHDD